jgi:hypothetical protein
MIITLWVKLKLHFWALSFFKYCKMSLSLVTEKVELSILFLNCTGFSSKFRRMRVLWGFIINCILTYFKIVYIYQLNFSFYETRYRTSYSVDTLSHLFLCFKKINFSKSTLKSPKFYLNRRQYCFCVAYKCADGQDLNILHLFLKNIKARYDRVPNTPTLRLSQNTIGLRTLRLSAVPYSQGT